MACALVVEDDASNQAVLRAILAWSGWTVFTAETPEEALAQCQRHDGRIDLFILDVVLPAGSGTEFAVRARVNHPDVPILFISGTPIDFWSQEDHQNLARLAGGSYYFLQKPFTCGALMQNVREQLARLAIARAA
jgi:DNA-binding response OmpR family regulator